MQVQEIRSIAQVCHEANRAYCETIGDSTQQIWDYAPDWQKDSAISGVIHVLLNPETEPEDSHKSWMAQKEREGWKHGAEKNSELKEHPCMVAYRDLPAAQQKKDAIFLAVAKALIGAGNA